jgi:hypothetical protein
MKWLKAIIAWFGMVIAGMAGGQGKTGGKAPRRFGIPIICLLVGFPAGLLFVFPLSMGYGVDSVLGDWLWHIEWLVRLVYALLLSLPFYFAGLWRGVVASVLLVAAFQVHAGSLGHISWFGDVLIEDIIRFCTLAALIIFNIFRKK